MRRKIAGPVKARRGQTVRISVKLRRGEKYGFVQVFVASSGGDPGPFVPERQLQVVTREPSMLTPTSLRLTDARPARELELTAYEDCSFYLMQDVDVADDKLAKGRIRTNGGWWQRIVSAGRWLCGRSPR